MQFCFFKLLEQEIRFKKREKPKNEQKYAYWKRNAMQKATWDKKVSSAVLGCNFLLKTRGRASDLFGVPRCFRKKIKVRKFKANRAIG